MKNKRIIVLTSVAAVGLAVFTAFIGQNQSKSWYKPSAKAEIISAGESEEAEGITGAAEWWFNRMKNVETGQIDMNEVLRVQELSRLALLNASAQRGSNPNVATAASWTELGPDNVGGRTRAILFDNQDATHQHMFAGGVSGGLWESIDAANTWHRCAGFFAVSGVVNTVVTIAQASNGDLYVGTGEGNFYPTYGTGAGGFTGGGIYKSTDLGGTWNVLSSTQPSNANSTSSAWISVNKIKVDPADPQHIYAGTNKGFKISSDGGVNWVSANGPLATAATLDVEISSNGDVMAVVSNKPWLSTDHGATFTNVGLTANGWSTGTATRVTVAFAPSDPNYVYAFLAQGQGTMLAVDVSIDKGAHWTQVCGAGNAQFDPFGGNGQGTYDNVVSVDPSNKMRAIFGGTALYEWNMITTNPIAGQWNQIAMEFPASAFNPYYVHSDKHEIIWHPTLAGVFYVGCDGGIFRTLNNGHTYSAMNAGYNVTQCYSVAIENTAGLKNQAMAGCQDNGTNFIDGNGNTSMSSSVTGGGDGAWCDISYLNPLATFQTVYFGALSRSNNRGASASSFYNTRITGITGFGTQAFASFVTPERLWESNNDLLSGDTIAVVDGRILQNKNITDGSSVNYTGNISVTIPVASPVGTLVLDSVRFACGLDTIDCNGSGNLSSPAGTTGTVNGVNGNYSITFSTAPAANKIIKAFFYLQYGAGTVFTVESNVAGKYLNHTVASQVNPGDTVKIQDVVQSHIAVGFTSNSGIWMTRRAIDFSTNPLWLKIAGTFSQPNPYAGECSCMAWSPNGDDLYVGTASGGLYRISNLGTVTDSAHGDVDHKSTAVLTVANPTCQVTCTLIGNFGGRDVSMIDVNPNNPNQVVVSLGNFSNTAYVYLTTVATTATNSTGTFVDKTGNLDNIGGVPCYTISFDKYVPNRVLVGTEHGVYETANITAAVPSFATAMNGFDVCPVDMIRQQRWENWQVPNSGCFYLASHGRGMWRDDSSYQPGFVGINTPASPYTNSENGINHDLLVFPNPVVDNSNVTFNLTKQGDASVKIYDLTGKLIYAQDYENLSVGSNTVRFETQEFSKGTYIITVLQGTKRIGSGRFIKMN